MLVVVEVVILFAGVIWRYVLDNPLVWTDELAGCCSCGWSASARSSRCAAASTCA